MAKRRRILRGILLGILAVVLLALGGFAAWASITMPAESGPLSSVTDDPAVELENTTDAVVMRPTLNDTGIGLVFIAGARVDPSAYADKLSGLVEQGMTVVIARPFLNFGILEFRPLSHFTDTAPDVTTWYVGGHSLGGVKACQYAESAAAGSSKTGSSGTDSPEVAGLILFGSYCATDLSATDLPVLSIAGSEDGLSTPQKIADNAHLLPADTIFVEIPGANHAQFGDYGTQSGDGTATATDADVRDAITEAVIAFVTGSG